MWATASTDYYIPLRRPVVYKLWYGRAFHVVCEHIFPPHKNVCFFSQDHLETIVKENKETITVGDFNVNYNNQSDNIAFKTKIKRNCPNKS